MRLRHVVNFVCFTQVHKNGPVAAISFPTSLEGDFVFPRNKTYAVVSPFPVVFAFQNANALSLDGAAFSWDLHCENNTFTGE
jgi:hypothetical protein